MNTPPGPDPDGDATITGAHGGMFDRDARREAWSNTTALEAPLGLAAGDRPLVEVCVKERDDATAGIIGGCPVIAGA
jgi:hypothetical protein